jgi:RNAse (barnase) inhibitor barstar
LTKDLNWDTGHNLNALNDLLRGGFGVHDYEEPIKLIWKESSASKIALGQQMFNDIIGLIRKHDILN